jgi:hypothetical protein
MTKKKKKSVSVKSGSDAGRTLANFRWNPARKTKSYRAKRRKK